MMDLRRASTVCLLREREELEILMVRRPHSARFMPGVWVFPGGVVDAQDASFAEEQGWDASLDWSVAALRELIEETGVWVTTEGTFSFPLVDDVLATVKRSPYRLAVDQLIYFSNWITPSVFPIRFDTRFFAVVASGVFDATFNREELIDVSWVAPLDALEREQRGEWDIAFPTRKTLEVLGSVSSVPDLLEMLRAFGSVIPVEPRLHVSESEAQILVPGDPGFDAAGPRQEDPTILARLSELADQGGRVPAEFKRRS